jgi:hypothetical protein
MYAMKELYNKNRHLHRDTRNKEFISVLLCLRVEKGVCYANQQLLPGYYDQKSS